MIKIEIRILKTSELSVEDEKKIVILKDQYWRYGLDSQYEWMHENARPDDCHAMIEEIVGDERILRSYEFYVNFNVELDNNKYPAIGLSCGCVDRAVRNKGWSRILKAIANQYIKENGKVGVFRCDKVNVPIWEKSGWTTIQSDNFYICDEPSEEEIMIYPANIPIQYHTVRFDRKF
jgi:hypothetical protein